MLKLNSYGFTHLLIPLFVTSVVIAITILAYFNLVKSSDNNKATKTSSQNLRYDIFPNTTEAPKLHLYWGESKQARFEPGSVQEIEKFGVFENIPVPACETPNDPGAEWAIHFNPGTLPIYAYASGTATSVQREGNNGEVVLRYGENYAVKYLHISKIPTNVELGAKVEAGTLLGYTPLFKESFGNSAGYEFWELEMNKIISGTVARAVFPLTYFDEESKAAFEGIRVQKNISSWFVDENSKASGWLAFTVKPETWADISKLGFTTPGDDYCKFLQDNELI